MDSEFRLMYTECLDGYALDGDVNQAGREGRAKRLARGVIWVEVVVEPRKAAGELLWAVVSEELCH